MVSELSARLLRGHNITFNLTTTTSNNRDGGVVSSDDGEEPKVSFSRRTEKLGKIVTRGRSSQGSPTVTATVATNKSRKLREYDSRDNDGCFKRRRIDDLQFAVSRVKEDLEKSGLPFPSLYVTNKRLGIFSDTAENKGVQLLSAKSVASSPFLTEIFGSMVSFSNTLELEDLFAVTYDYYSKPRTPSTRGASSSDSGSSCCLKSEGEKSNSSSISDSSGIPALLDTALSSNEGNHTNKSSGDVATEKEDLGSLIYSNPITIGEAFVNSDEPRLVTLSFAPFLIVHVNSSYARMTGLSPADVLGKAFHEVIQDQMWKGKASKASSLSVLHEQVTDFAVSSENSKKISDNKTRNKRFGMKVTVVSAAEHEEAERSHNSITHFMVALEEEKDAATLAPQLAGASSTRAAVCDTIHRSNGTGRRQASLDMPSSPTPSMTRFHCGVMG